MSMRPETFGERLRRLRTERGMAQRELSDEGVTYAYISRLESGTRTSPSITAIRKVAARLKVNPVYLETGQMEWCPHCGGVPDPSFK